MPEPVPPGNGTVFVLSLGRLCFAFVDRTFAERLLSDGSLTFEALTGILLK